jgi:hypothetical protein
MIITRKSFLIGAATLAATSWNRIASAEEYEWDQYKPGDVKFRRPKSWTASMEGDVHTLRPPANTPGDFRVWTRAYGGVPAEREAATEISRDAAKRVKKAITTSNPPPTTRSGLTYYQSSGTGLSEDDKPRWWWSTVVAGPGTKGIVQTWVWTSPVDIPIINSVVQTIQRI